VEEDEDDLLDRVDTEGELETRFKDLGCNGDWGIEFDRRSALRAEALIKSLADSFLRTGAGDLIASVRALSVALMTSVASSDRSFGDKCSSESVFPCSTLPFRGFAVGVLVVLALDVSADLPDFLEMACVLVIGALGFGNKSSLSIVAIAGVQVDVEPIAARTESADSCKEAIMIQNEMQMLLEIKHYSRIC
jgi:hypothetical protein